jgi:hypothetical protein
VWEAGEPAVKLGERLGNEGWLRALRCIAGALHYMVGQTGFYQSYEGAWDVSIQLASCRGNGCHVASMAHPSCRPCKVACRPCLKPSVLISLLRQRLVVGCGHHWACLG